MWKNYKDIGKVALYKQNEEVKEEMKTITSEQPEEKEVEMNEIASSETTVALETAVAIEIQPEKPE